VTATQMQELIDALQAAALVANRQREVLLEAALDAQRLQVSVERAVNIVKRVQEGQ
jgi:hypothetical protein